MNTIIYVYRGRDNAKFKIEKLDESDYCLIRLGLPVLLWKHLKQLDQETQDKTENESAKEHISNSEVSEGGYSRTGSITENGAAVTVTEKKAGKKAHPKQRCDRVPVWKKKFLWKRRRVIGKNASPDGMGDTENSFEDAGRAKVQESLAVNAQPEEGEAQKQEALRKEALRQRVTELLGELEALQTALCLLGGNTYWTYTVYEERLRTKVDTFSWRDAWSIPEFDDYSQPLWAEKLLSYGDCPNFLILGQSDCIPRALVANARKLRSVKWYLLQKEYTEEAEAFIDSFYEEYGLVIEVHLLEERKDWWRAGFHCPDPVKVLDFTGEAKTSAYGVAKGSIWLDMNAMDEKSGRMEVRNQGISYFSLKKLWGGIQKPVNDLDTPAKNGYNT